MLRRFTLIAGLAALAGLVLGATVAYAAGPRGQMAGHGGNGDHGLITVAAEELGLTQDELVAELQEGKTIAQVAEERNVTLETIVAALVASREGRLDDAVAAGRITQEQADEHLALIEAQATEHLTQMLPIGDADNGGVCFGDGAATQHGFGAMGRFGGMGRFGSMAR